jgi:hypothetical protein
MSFFVGLSLTADLLLGLGKTEMSFGGSSDLEWASSVAVFLTKMLFVVDLLLDSGKADAAGTAGTAGRAGIVGKVGPTGKVGTAGTAGIAGTSGTAGTSGISASVDTDLRLPMENLLPLELGVAGASLLPENKTFEVVQNRFAF